MRRSRRARAAWLLAAWLAGCSVNIPRAPADVASADIERYRFGMYQECRAAGDLRGESVAAASAFCDCVYDLLTGKVSEDEWRRVVYLNLSGRGVEERATLAPMLSGVSLCRSAAAPQDAAPAAQPARAIVGVWAWRRPFDGCAETFEFRADGTARVERGDERTENSYRVAPAPEAGGRFRIDLAPTWFSSGMTCEKVFRDAAERAAPVYVLFGPRFETLAVCASPGGADCAGPMRRRREPE